MHDFSMPGGEPEWHGNLGDKDLDSLFSFIELYLPVVPGSKGAMEERRRESKEDLSSFVEGKDIPLTLGDGTSLPKGNKRIFSFRDSLHLLPGKLDSLAKSLCPGLGSKGSFDHKKVTVENLGKMRASVLMYMEQDIRLLGGVCNAKFLKVVLDTLQGGHCERAHLFSYGSENLSQNEDTFICCGYCGGLTDAYKKLGRNLFYYDVNSLYPFIMKKCPMPGVKKPFLPVRGKDGTLLFPTGDLVGVYYSEELKYARDISYIVIPVSGYLFEKKESLFIEYVNSHFDSRLQAKKDGNEALLFVYKILMVSLYGRFGINPNSTKTELCDSERYHFLMKQDSFISFHPIIENLYMVSYHTVTADDNIHWAQPKNSAVQLSAAITACTRIYIHPFTSKDDCYYIDTNFIVLANPLLEGLISSKVLGLFKLEDKIKEGYFLAPKAYGYISEEDTNVIKFKGPAKHLVDISWFREQLANPSRRMKVQIKNEFEIDWDNQTVGVKEYDYNLGIKLNSKRITQPDGETLPIEVNDMCGVAKSLFKKLMKL
ncbi:uncharacterized protein LOC110711201 [Chenopodium quinoa]|uniref:uncharacterized protein LOC110711201 n=1 Tax=Chenopodium quinoa TaxID=63459 RepID=UPI000B796C55|nr:uncharacterized protein LOC110711201 [Chenopodium quinoa]